MVDLLVAALGYFAAFYLLVALETALLHASAFLRRVCRGSAGDLPLLIASAAAGLLTATWLAPHLFAHTERHLHAASDRDLMHPEHLHPWGLVLLVVVVARVLLRLVAECKFSVSLARTRTRHEKQREQRLGALLHNELRTAGLRLRLHRFDDAASPFVRGLLRPRLYLHVDLAGALDLESLRAIVHHEAEHRRGGDLWLRWFDSLVLASLPLPAELRRRYDAALAEREFACDRAAAHALENPLAVASALLQVARFISRKNGQTHLAAASFSAGAFRHLERRVQALVSSSATTTSTPERPPSAFSRFATAGALSALIAFALFVSIPSNAKLEVFCALEHALGVHCLAG